MMNLTQLRYSLTDKLAFLSEEQKYDRFSVDRQARITKSTN